MKIYNINMCKNTRIYSMRLIDSCWTIDWMLRDGELDEDLPVLDEVIDRSDTIYTTEGYSL